MNNDIVKNVLDEALSQFRHSFDDEIIDNAQAIKKMIIKEYPGSEVTINDDKTLTVKLLVKKPRLITFTLKAEEQENERTQG